MKISTVQLRVFLFPPELCYPHDLLCFHKYRHFLDRINRDRVRPARAHYFSATIGGDGILSTAAAVARTIS
jgi:hypothetical protein